MPDRYTRRARLAPAFLAAVPPLALFGAGIASVETTARFLGIGFGAAGLLLAGAVRDRGRGIQDGLWAKWGGSPTLRRLRWASGGAHDDVERRHASVQEATGLSLPTAREEAADPERADRSYEAAIARLRERTRTPPEDFKLVLEENMEYGFRRNVLGIRPWGLAIAISSLALCVGELAFGSGDFGDRAVQWGCAGGISLVATLLWLAYVTEAWVRRAGEHYADRLLAAADTVVRNSETQTLNSGG